MLWLWPEWRWEMGRDRAVYAGCGQGRYDAPTCCEFITERENREPNRDTPKTDSDAPSRAKLLIDTDDPRCAKSNTEIDEPNLEKVRKDTADPR